MEHSEIKILVGDKKNQEHIKAMFEMLDLYMQDPMGKSAPLQPELQQKVASGLQLQANYLFFLIYVNEQPAGVANCFVNYSTFKAKQLINIHDFAVSPNFRRMGLGEKLMNFVLNYAKQNDFCRVNLEVRHDNPEAQYLYKKVGFEECKPAMYFWEYNF